MQHMLPIDEQRREAGAGAGRWVAHFFAEMQTMQWSGALDTSPLRVVLRYLLWPARSMNDTMRAVTSANSNSLRLRSRFPLASGSTFKTCGRNFATRQYEKSATKVE